MTAASTPATSFQSARRVGLGTLAQLLARVAGVGMGIAVAALLARGLGAVKFGQFSLLLALVALAVGAGDFGLAQVAVREMAADPSRRNTIASGLVAAKLVLGIILGVTVALAGWLLLSGRQGLIAAMLVAATLPLGGVNALKNAAQARLRPHVVSLLTLAQSALWLGGVAGLASVGAPLPAYAAVFLAIAMFQGGLAYLLTRRLVEIRLAGSVSLALRLLRMSWPLGVAGVFVTAYYRLDAVLLYRIAGPEQTALYAAAYRFLDVLQVVPATGAALLLPLASSLSRLGDARSFSRAFELSVGMMLAVAAPIVAGGVVIARPLVTAIYGRAFADSATLLAILLPAFLSISLGYVLTTILLAARRIRLLAVTAATAAVLNVVANLFLIPTWGARAAAGTTLATEFAVFGTIGTVLVRDLRLHLPWARITRIAAAVALMLAATFALRGFGVIATIAGSAVVYILVALAVGAIDLPELRGLLRKDVLLDV